MFVSGTELRTNGQTDKRTNRQTDGGQTDDLYTRCPRRTFQAGGIKIPSISFLHRNWQVMRLKLIYTGIYDTNIEIITVGDRNTKHELSSDK